MHCAKRKIGVKRNSIWVQVTYTEVTSRGATGSRAKDEPLWWHKWVPETCLGCKKIWVSELVQKYNKKSTIVRFNNIGNF